ncbi:hypothetical protein GGS20DRAFT_531943 [Poronia punctata]|nr:hypothetical protein GGS20DRAFT_531943 [Poronia punctata]
MADVEAAIAAAMSAAAPNAPPISPVIKSEHFTGDSMIIDSEPQLPTQSPQSPLKRSRSPDDANNTERDGHREEKRMKIEPAPDNGLDEIARMVQAVQASVMQDILSTPAPELGPASEPKQGLDTEPQPQSDSHIDADDKPHIKRLDEVFETTEQEQANIDAALEAALNEQRSPSRDGDTRPDTLWSNPRDYTRRKHIIPALGALAVDILIALSEQTLEDTVATLTSDPDSDITKEYGVLREAFDTQRRQLSRPKDAPRFFDADQLGIKGETKEVIRIVNLASTCASIFGTNDITLEEVNNYFLRIFIPEGQALTHDAAELYLGLKTQLFLAVLEGEMDKGREQYLEEIFVIGVEESLVAHHPDFPLTTSELDFVANSKARKVMLSIASAPPDSVYALSRQFTYEAFLDGLSTYLNDNINNIQAQVLHRVDFRVPVASPTPADNDAPDLTDEFDLNAAIEAASRAAAQSALQQPGAEDIPTFEDLSAFLTENVSRAVEQSRQAASNVELPSSIASAAESASRATALALESIARNQYHPTALPHSSNQGQSSTNQQGYQLQQQTAQAQTPSQLFPYQQQQQQHQQQQHHQQHHHQSLPPPPLIPSNVQITDHLPPNQTDSTPALYERARQAAAARSSTHARREGSHSTRRPWSPEEEKALMMGLDMVKGPHWSQILSLFGPNGSISQILADRTQVQLKDKARNLKLFFLKTNSEMPYYLQCVTGELKTRAPTQAARKEAEEKARLNSEEHQAHMNGILALAGGLQNNTSQQRSSPSRPAPNNTTSQPQPNTIAATAQAATHQPSQTMIPPQSHRPAVPAPQPVRLPTLTPTHHQHHTQQTPAKQEHGAQQMQQTQQTQQTATRPETSSVTQPVVKQEEQPTHHAEPIKQQEEAAAEPFGDHSGLSIEDRALLGLKAAMEGESAAAAPPQSPTYIKQEHA